MNPGKSGLAVLGLAAVLTSPAPASAQVAFQPVVSAFPDGVALSATPVVSADRRYVRLGMNPMFTGLEGFNAYSVPAAVSGGGVGGGGLRSVGVPGMAVGMDGPVGQDPYGYGYGYGYAANAGVGPGFAPADPAMASAVLSGTAGYPDRPRLSAGLVRTPMPKASTRAKRGRSSSSRAKRP